MADEKPHEFLIIKRVRGHGDDSHGGAWKIAFADFMTAMMALFLVLWLISATNEKTKASLARYFNPVKLVDMTVQKRGLNDPVERSAEDASSAAPPPSKRGAQLQAGTKDAPPPKGAKPQSSTNAADYLPSHSEAALFRDPYAVLAAIAASGPATKAPATPEVDHPNVGAAASFQDPFQAGAPEVPQQVAPQPPAPAAPDQLAARTDAAPAAPVAEPPKAEPPKPLPAQQAATKPPDKPADQPSPAAAAMARKEVAPSLAKSEPAHPAEVQPKQPPAEDVQAVRLQTEIATALGKGEAAPNIQVKPTPQGIVISLTDGFNYAMFAIGSAEPQPRTLQIMATIARILKKEKGKIVISGHTDGRRYKSQTYDNWRLSEARAQMALYMLVRGGLDEKRIDRIEGAADHVLKVPNDPMAAQNRRIEILLRETKS
ncbi:MAG: MotB family protein [Methylovirgula sp.]